MNQPYTRVRPNIQDGDLIAWKGTSLGARIVQWWTGTPWSHVGIAVWWDGRLMVMESYPGKGTRAHPLSKDINRAYWIPTGIRYSWLMHSRSLDLMDLKYSMLNNWKAAWGMKLVKSRKQCAQFCCDIFEMAGLRVPFPPTPASVVEMFGDVEPVLLLGEDSMIPR